MRLLLMTSFPRSLGRSTRAVVLLGTLAVIILAFFPGGAQSQDASASAQIVLLIDRSGSAQTNANAPRMRFARFLVDALRVQSWVSGSTIDLAISDFGGTVEERRPLTRLADDQIVIPPNTEPIQLTDFRVPLRYARNLFHDAGEAGDHKRLVIVLTDGIPQLQETFSLPESEIPSYFGAGESASSNSVQAALSALAASGAQTFLLIDDANDDRAKGYSSAWKKVLPKGHYLSIGQAQARFTAARTLLAAIAGGRIGLQKLGPGEAFSLSVSKPYRALGILTLHSSPGADFEIRSPSGGRLLPAIDSPQDNYEFYFVPSPSQGSWRLTARGEASDFYAWVGPEAQARLSQPPAEGSHLNTYLSILLTVAVLGLAVAGGFWVLSLRRNLLAAEGVIAKLEESDSLLAERLKQAEEELERLSGENSELRIQSDTLREAREKREDALKALKEGNEKKAEEFCHDSLGLILDFADQGADLAVKEASETYGAIERLPPDRQWALIQRLVSDQQSRELSRDQVRVLAQVLRQRWQRDSALLLDEFYALQLWSKGDWLIEDLSTSPSFTEEPDRDVSASLMRRLAEQRKRLNGFFGDVS